MGRMEFPLRAGEDFQKGRREGHMHSSFVCTKWSYHIAIWVSVYGVQESGHNVKEIHILKIFPSSYH